MPPLFTRSMPPPYHGAPGYYLVPQLALEKEPGFIPYRLPRGFDPFPATLLPVGFAPGMPPPGLDPTILGLPPGYHFVGDAYGGPAFVSCWGGPTIPAYNRFAAKNPIGDTPIPPTPAKPMAERFPQAWTNPAPDSYPGQDKIPDPTGYLLMRDFSRMGPAFVPRRPGYAVFSAPPLDQQTPIDPLGYRLVENYPGLGTAFLPVQTGRYPVMRLRNENDPPPPSQLRMPEIPPAALR